MTAPCPFCHEPGGFHYQCARFSLPGDWHNPIVIHTPEQTIGTWLTPDLREHVVRYLNDHPSNPPGWAS